MTGTDIRLLSWGLLNGGIDGADEECRRMKQLNFLSTLPQLDVLWLMETTGWEGQDDCRLADLHDATGLTPLGRVTSHVDDGYRALIFANGNRVQVETAGELERGAFHPGPGHHVTSYRTHDTPDLRRQYTQLPMSIDVRLAL
ncbi:hypothetical protein ACIQJX_26410 [Streptomyces griseoviridis]